MKMIGKSKQKFTFGCDSIKSEYLVKEHEENYD